jgi:hypothetical protein
LDEKLPVVMLQLYVPSPLGVKAGTVRRLTPAFPVTKIGAPEILVPPFKVTEKVTDGAFAWATAVIALVP